MSFVNVQCDDLLKELVERLIAVSDNQRALLREVVVNVGDDLDSHIGLTRSRRSNNLQTPNSHACKRGHQTPTIVSPGCIPDLIAST